MSCRDGISLQGADSFAFWKNTKPFLISHSGCSCNQVIILGRNRTRWSCTAKKMGFSYFCVLYDWTMPYQKQNAQNWEVILFLTSLIYSKSSWSEENSNICWVSLIERESYAFSLHPAISSLEVSKQILPNQKIIIYHCLGKYGEGWASMKIPL